MIKVLSLFDGLGGARVALDQLGIKCKYYASEIDGYAIKIAKKNYPDIMEIGSVVDIKGILFSESTDLLIGGSPCQDLSIAKAGRKGLQGERSGLFWEYVRILREVKPKYFVLENVASMNGESKQTITDALGVEPIMINSALVTAQQRKRLYWTNILNVTQPEDRKIYLNNIIEEKVIDSSYCVEKPDRIGKIGNGGQGERVYSINGKSVSLSANGGGRGAKTGLYEIKNQVRKLTPIECERLQGLPDNYTEGVSNTQRYRMIGNGFTAPVIKHILKNMEAV